MKKWFVRLKLTGQLTLVSCIFMLIPLVLLWYTILKEQQTAAIQTCIQSARSSCVQAKTQTQRTAELCNMSTQVYLNTPQLIEYLIMLKNGEDLNTAEVLRFYRTTVASLEKITLSNPDLYQIRLYAEAEDFNEMMPILFSRSRMAQAPWVGKKHETGSWQLDYDDIMFSDYATPHIMSLVTDIDDPSLGLLGTLEVSVRMDETFPELFTGTAEKWTVLTDENGTLLAGNTEASDDELRQLVRTENETQCLISGKRVLVAKAELKEIGCTYLQVTDLSDIYRSVFFRSIRQLLILFVAFGVMMLAVSRLTSRLLRGFYGAFDGMREFANGNIDAAATVEGENEAADFAREANGLLDKIRQLMHDNIERELQAQHAEMRALQNQINAHFIYNVLEAIKMMAEIDEEYEIADTVTTLGKLLRYSLKLESGGVRLERELDNVRNYIALMNLRFDYTISLEIDVPITLLGQTIPKLSLQPIVENAVVHGAEALAEDSTVRLIGKADCDLGIFKLDIIDRGAGMDEETLECLRRSIEGEKIEVSTSGSGIGLKNVHDRIQMTFGKEFGLSVSSQRNMGTVVTVTLPYREEGKHNENNTDCRR